MIGYDNRKFNAYQVSGVDEALFASGVKKGKNIPMKIKEGEKMNGNINNEKEAVVCWNCKTKYLFVKNRNGPTYVICPKCGAKGMIPGQNQQSQMPQHQVPYQQPPVKTKKHLVFRIPKTSFNWTLLAVIALGMALIACFVFATSTSTYNGDLRLQLTVTNDALLTTSNSLTNVSNSLVSTQDSLTTSQSQLSTTQGQLYTATTDLNNANSLVQVKIVELNVSEMFIQSFLKANGNYYKAIDFEITGNEKKDFAYTWYINATDNATMNSSILNYTEAMNYYNISQQKMQDSILLYQNAKNYTTDLLYNSLCVKGINWTTAYYNALGHEYNASKYAKLTGEYLVNNDSFNITELANKTARLNNSGIVTEMQSYNTDMLAYKNYFAEYIAALKLLID